MTRAGIFGFAVLALQGLAIPATAQYLSMCMASFPVACCKASYAKYGAFGAAHGSKKEARMAELVACQARKAKR